MKGRRSIAWWVGLLLMTSPVGCAPLHVRATAPDESSNPLASPPVTPPSYAEPTVLVHFESTEPALLVKLGDRYEAVDACAAPCDRELPLDGLYRIDGATIRSSSAFHLDGKRGEQIVVRVSPRTRAAHATANTVSYWGAGITLGSVLYDVIVGLLGPAPPNDGGPASPPPSFVAAEAAGLVVGAVGLSLWIGGLAASMGNFDSGMSQSSEPRPAKFEVPAPEGIITPGGFQSALPRPTAVPLLQIHF
jgi:hypothetical protein